MAGTYFLKRCLKKTRGTEKQKDADKKRYGVITSPWRLRLQ